MEEVILEGWSSDIADAIEDAIRETPERKVATLDFDNTCIHGDIGELFSHYLARHVGYRTDLDEFWDLIHPDDGRESLKSIARELQELDDHSAHEQHGAFVGELAALYLRKLDRDGKRNAYAWAVLLHVGMTVDEILDHSAICLSEELDHPFETETWPLLDGTTITMPRGLRPRAEMQSLISYLSARDVEVWIVSASNQWTVSVAAKLFGVPESRALGNTTVLEGNRLTSTLNEPSFFREGKREVVLRDIGVSPILAFGDSDTDIEMMELAKVAVAIDRGNKTLAEAIAANGWFTRDEEDFTLVEDR